MLSRYGLRFAALGYLTLLLVLPVAMVFRRAFENGVGAAWDAVTTPEAKHAFLTTIVIALIAVPANTIFGIACAIAIVRHRFPGKGVVNAIVDLPLALSPIVVGLSFLLLFGTGGWFAGVPFEVLFALPAMVLATIFVSLPFVVREVVPVLVHVGVDQEQAAYTMGASPLRTFRTITLPNIRWGLLYGVSLTFARALGEFGAVLVVSGSVSRWTETSTLFIFRALDDRNEVGAYAMALALAAASFGLLLGMEYFKKHNRED